VYIDKVMENDIQKMDRDDPWFPESLREMPSGPKVLYCRGEWPRAGEKMIAMVGSRICSDYGKRAGRDIAQGLVEAGFTIVSGLTPGIDTIGHTVAVENGKRTVAVLGTGIDRQSLYPKSNLDLSEEIVKNGGCLLSEYPAGTRGAKFTFPQRNRIVAGLSLGVVVIEAKEKSGSLITARWAKKLGNPVFAVPGSIYSLNSEGCNELIRQGALLTRKSADVLEALGYDPEPKQATMFGNASAEEKLILEVISGEALETDKIIAATGLAAAQALSLLSLMEIKGLVKSIGGMKYYKSR
jgi:DNA processing protein